MKKYEIATHCVFCENKLQIHGSYWIGCLNEICRSKVGSRHVFVLNSKRVLNSIHLSSGKYRLIIYPENNFCNLHEETYGLKFIFSFSPILDIDINSKEDIINKINLLLTFQ